MTMNGKPEDSIKPDIQADNRHVLEIFGNGLLKKCEAGQITREEIMGILRGKFEEIIGQHGDNIAYSMVAGGIAENVYSSLHGGEKIDSGALEQTIKDFFNGQSMRLMGPVMSRQLVNTLKEFPLEKSYDFVEPMLLTISTLMALGGTGTCISTGFEKYSNSTNQSVILAGWVLFISAFIFAAITAKITGRYIGANSTLSYEDFVRYIKKSAEPKAIEMTSGIENMAGLMTRENLNEMSPESFSAAVKSITATLVYVDDYLKGKQDSGQAVKFTAYRGTFPLDDSNNRQMIQDCVEQGVEVLIRDKKQLGEKRREERKLKKLRVAVPRTKTRVEVVDAEFSEDNENADQADSDETAQTADKKMQMRLKP